MTLPSRRALAILNVLIFVLLFSIMSGIILTLVSSQTRLLEHHIRRIKGYYGAEAASVAAIDLLRRTGSMPNPFFPPAIDWTYDTATGNPASYKQGIVSPTSAIPVPLGTLGINATFDYTGNW